MQRSFVLPPPAPGFALPPVAPVRACLPFGVGSASTMDAQEAQCFVVRSKPPTEYSGVWACTSRDAVGPESDQAGVGAGQEDHDCGGDRVPALVQRRRGANHGAGGRRRGTGKNTRATLKEGYKRAIASHLIRFGVHKWLDCLSNPPDTDQRVAMICFLDESLDGVYRGEVWAMEALVGAVARMSYVDSHKYNEPMLISCWVASRGNVACTCVQSTRYEAMFDAEAASVPDTPCYHTKAFRDAAADLAAVLGVRTRTLLRDFGKQSREASPASVPSVLTTRAPPSTTRRARPGRQARCGDEVEIFDTGGLPISVVISGAGRCRIPAPVQCNRKASACCYCDSSRCTSCTHVLQTRHLRRGDASGTRPGATARMAAQGTINSVSKLPLSLFDCNKSVLVDVNIFDHARRNQKYVVPAPDECSACATPRGSAKLRPSRNGTILCHMGFCAMQLDGYDCGGCNKWVCADGREHGVVILSTCKAASVSLVRHFCQEVAVEGDAFAKTFKSWWVKAVGRSSAGVFPRLSVSRSRRTVSRLLSAGLRLMSADPPKWSFECDQCCVDGRFRVITADGISLGYLRRLVSNYYEHYSEDCQPDTELLAAASLIASEWVRRFLRLCLTHPEQAITVAIDQRRSAVMALSVLCPASLPVELLSSTLHEDSVAVRLRDLVSQLWHLPTAVVSLVKGLLAATTKVIASADAANKAVSETAAERALQSALRAWLMTPRVENRRPEPMMQQPAPNAAVAVPMAHGVAAGAAHPGGVLAAGAAFAGGVCPSAPATPRGALMPCASDIPADVSSGVTLFCLALVADPIVSPFKPHHCAPLRSLIHVLRQADAAATLSDLCAAAAAVEVSEATVRAGMDLPLLLMLQELKLVLVSVTSMRNLGNSFTAVALAMANVLEDGCARIEKYHSDKANVPGSAAAFEQRWSGDGKTPEEMVSFFLSQFPNASDDPLVTGSWFPGRRQCRASAFSPTDKPDTGTCSKNYQAARKSFTPGAFLICCACAHPRVLGFVVLDKREGPPALLNAFITRFAKLPEYIVYDFGCGAVRTALTKLPWLLRSSTVTSDEFHVVNHVCSIALDPRSFLTLDKANTVAHEQRNRAIKLLSRVLRASGQTEYTRVLAYHTFIHNVRALARQACPETLPDVYDYGRFFFSRESCLCGCGYTVQQPFAAVDDVPGAAAGASSSSDEDWAASGDNTGSSGNDTGSSGDSEGTNGGFELAVGQDQSGGHGSGSDG